MQTEVLATPPDAFHWLGEINKASVVMVVEQGIVPAALGARIAEAIAEVIAAGHRPNAPRPGDYLALEAALIEAGGPDVTRVHSGRSRQDISATFGRLFLRDDLLSALDSLLLTLAHTGTFGLSILVGTWITTFLLRDVGLPLPVAGGLGSAVLVVGILARPGGGIVIDQGWMRATTMIRSSLLAGTCGLGLLALPGRPVWLALLALLVMGIALSLPYAAVMHTATAAVPASPGAAIGLIGAGSLILIAAGAPVLGAIYARTASFSLAFGLLGAFAFVVFWLTRQSFSKV